MKILYFLLIALLSVYAVSSLKLISKKKLGLIGGGLLIKPKLKLKGIGLLAKPKLKLKAGGLLGGGLVGKKLFKNKCGCRVPCGHSVLLRKRRSIGDMASNLSTRLFDTVSNRLENTGENLRSFGDRFHRGSDFIRNASFTTRIAGIFASERIRSGANSLLGSSTGSSSSSSPSLVRRRRATNSYRRPVPSNFRMPQGKMSLEEMLNFVKQHNAEVCLQRVICELSAKSNMYGEEGIRFGTRLLNYNNVANEEAAKYKRASRIGNQYRGRPQACSKKYPQSQCNYDSNQLIAVGNSILY